MKKKYSFIFVVCFLFFLVFLLANQSQSPQWKGTIEYEDGIKVIKNPKEPLYGELEFDLEDDLSIGNEKNENYLFYKVRDMGVDNQGNIYVVDMGNHRIQIYDKDGNYLQTIGKVGQGPGDFQLPAKVQIEETTGIIYVLDMFREIDIFDEQREYIKSLHTDFVHGMIPADDGNIFIVAWKASDYDLSSVDILCKINFAGEITKFSREYPFTRYARKLSSGATLSMSTGYELGLHLAKLDRETYIFGYSKEYKLNVINSEGQLIYKIQKEEAPPEFTSKEKQIFKRMILPEYKPYFFSIFGDSRGRICLQRNRQSWREPDSDMEVDIFSIDGYFLYEATLPPCSWVIKKGLLYIYTLDEEKGMEYIKRYKIKNWEQIKTGI